MCYGFLVKEINYKNKENEVITINSFNEQTAGQAGRWSRAPKWSDYKKTQLNCYDSVKNIHVVTESVILNIEYWKDHCYLILSILK